MFWPLILGEIKILWPSGRRKLLWIVDEAEFRARLAPFHFDLPEDLIAAHPLPERDLSRLLVVHRQDGSIREEPFRALPDLLSPRDLLVFNRTRVSFRRLKLVCGTRVYEPLLIELIDGKWHALTVRAARLKEGARLIHEASGLVFIVRGRAQEKVVFEAENPPRDWEAFFAEFGDVPIPPYLNRASTAEDRERYNTIFAGEAGSIAAPTAGLHFTEAVMNGLAAREIDRTFVELSIGTGTFAPLRAQNFEDNRLHREHYRITEEAAHRILTAPRVIAVGTTTLRALESTVRAKDRVEPGEYSTEIFLRPPDQIRSVQGLITNFHLPESSLFMLVCAFAGTDLMQEAYARAVRGRMRFYSYGDAMLII